MELRIATCAYPVSADPARNERWVRRQMGEARERGAQIALFSIATIWLFQLAVA